MDFQLEHVVRTREVRRRRVEVDRPLDTSRTIVERLPVEEHFGRVTRATVARRWIGAEICVGPALNEEDIEVTAVADLEGHGARLFTNRKRDGTLGKVVHEVNGIPTRIEAGVNPALAIEERHRGQIAPFAWWRSELPVHHDLPGARWIDDRRSIPVAGIAYSITVRIRLIWVECLGAVVHSIKDTVAVIVLVRGVADPVTISVNRARPIAMVADVANPVEVAVGLSRIGYCGTVVLWAGIGREPWISEIVPVRVRARIAHVAQVVAVRVYLGGVRHGQTVVAHIAHAVLIGVVLGDVGDVGAVILRAGVCGEARVSIAVSVRVRAGIGVIRYAITVPITDGAGRWVREGVA